jgi:hypothetical protein
MLCSLRKVCVIHLTARVQLSSTMSRMFLYESHVLAAYVHPELVDAVWTTRSLPPHYSLSATVRYGSTAEQLCQMTLKTAKLVEDAELHWQQFTCTEVTTVWPIPLLAEFHLLLFYLILKLIANRLKFIQVGLSVGQSARQGGRF